MTTSGPGPDLLSQQLWPPHFLCTPLLSLQTLHSPPCILQSLQTCYYSAHLNVNKQELEEEDGVEEEDDDNVDEDEEDKIDLHSSAC